MAERITKVSLEGYTNVYSYKRGRLTVTMEDGKTFPVESPTEEFESPGTGSYTPQRDRGIELARKNDVPFIEVDLDHIRTIRKERPDVKFSKAGARGPIGDSMLINLETGEIRRLFEIGDGSEQWLYEGGATTPEELEILRLLREQAAKLQKGPEQE